MEIAVLHRCSCVAVNPMGEHKKCVAFREGRGMVDDLQHDSGNKRSSHMINEHDSPVKKEATTALPDGANNTIGGSCVGRFVVEPQSVRNLLSTLHYCTGGLI